MKNAMKKLMSVLLVAVLLISAVPFAASAAETYTVDVTVKDASDNILATNSFVEANGQNSTVQNYLDATFGGWSSNYNVTKYWVKNDETGSNGLTVNADHVVTRDTRVVIKLERKPVTLKLDIYFDGKYTTTVTKSVAYGSTVTLNDALAAEAGYGSYNTDVRTASLAEGQSFVADENAPNIQIMVVSGNSNGSSSNTGSNNSSSSSSTTTRKDITVNIKNVEGGSVVQSFTVTPSGATAKVSDILYYYYGNRSNDWMNTYTCTKACSSFIGDNVGYNGVVSEGDTLTIVLTKKNDNGSNNSSSNNSGITNKDNTNQVWLHVYTNGNASTIAKSINLTSTYLMDDNSTNTTEIKNYLLTNYYKAKDSSKNVELDGLYLNKGTSGTFPQNYYTDGNKFPTLSDIDDMLDDGYVHISVMLKNVTAKSSTSSTADTSNPKTGDSIYTAMTVMGISAASLAAVMYIYTKKRQAI